MPHCLGVRTPVLSLLVGAALSTAGCSANGNRTSGARSAPASASQPGLAQLGTVIRGATHSPPVLPGFKIRASAARGLDGLDLWNAVVDPMIARLTRLDGTQRLRHPLNPAQYAVYVLFAVDTDIDDGGISEVYYNSSGVFADSAVSLLRTVGARRHANVLAQANRLIAPSGPVPGDRATRQRRLTALGSSRLASLDAAWGALKPLEGLVARFIRAHPRDFFV